MKEDLVIGETYNVSHSRKGSLLLKLTGINGSFVIGIITAGKADAVMSYNAAEVGEEVSLRITFCSFQKI